MSTDAVTPLRHRMIEDMNARKLCAGTQRGPFFAYGISRSIAHRSTLSAGHSSCFAVTNAELGRCAPNVRIAADISLAEHKFEYEQNSILGSAVSMQMFADILSLVAQPAGSARARMSVAGVLRGQ